MKKIFLLLFIAVTITVNAQKNVIIDTFEDNSYSWTEDGNRNAKSFISGGALFLKIKKDNTVTSWAQLPVDYNENFKITYKIKLHYKTIFGFIKTKKVLLNSFNMLFNLQNDGTYNSFGVVSGRQYSIKLRDKEPEIMNFNFGKKTDYEIQIVKRGSSMDFIINGIEFNTIKNVNVNSNWFGINFGNVGGLLSLEEVIIEQ